ncbi:gluconokinase [Arthrobacter sp. H35-D1]|uniref:gluconokinase n=1 Tax=Arthrobacter sp. H35-D1 TaxID=3046202 RepID=UPI0024B8FF8E|nr:gluconokinase [Arthrobacter sp. H35-D1]MDJ0313024.1 gluconokinase [Arthrobacter sp. H35-D1]
MTIHEFATFPDPVASAAASVPGTLPESGVPGIIVMGVSGAGKSTIGALVADAMNFPFVDADSLHPVANIRKMAAGTPLNDADRQPWLELVGHELSAAKSPGIVIACSALKRRYRDIIRSKAPGTIFLQLDGSLEVLSSRLEGRSGHFMPVALLASQLAALEPVADDERAVVIDISAGIGKIVVDAEAGIRSLLGS